ncbi:MAG: L,D-transpeptidase [Firmicutes bacterium]|nr:L,D-transpeptidase [Bacillota bacterium]
MFGVPAGEDRIVIVKSENMLYWFERGRLAKKYEVATGVQPHYTPEGMFTIANKIVDPGGPEGKPQLGNRWMGLAVPPERDRRSSGPDERAPAGLKYGIHGTNEPESIGEHASGGCIRMHDEDVVELFERVDVGTVVEIRP